MDATRVITNEQRTENPWADSPLPFPYRSRNVWVNLSNRQWYLNLLLILSCGTYLSLYPLKQLSKFHSSLKARSANLVAEAGRLAAMNTSSWSADRQGRCCCRRFLRPGRRVGEGAGDGPAALAGRGPDQLHPHPAGRRADGRHVCRRAQHRGRLHGGVRWVRGRVRIRAATQLCRKSLTFWFVMLCAVWID